ncbi:MAG: enoyl-CoA hydratase/isomerase family protein, partial [Fimbriimonadaceae bacterium]|nr:enoyl-CoA hydratase/isomerase family protein [Alphaproteobacteria bacterium]
MNEFVSYERHGNVGVITINNPPVNALGFGVRSGLVDSLHAGNNDADADILVLIGGGRTFPAGADITEFGKPMQAPDLSAVIAEFENSEKVIVAAVHGTALGGGLELTFGCDYRCGIESARVGLPEVNLGILPGAGGTQRLARVIGAEAALDMIISGAMVDGKKAAELGIFDKLVDGDLLEGAITYASELAASNAPHRRIRDMSVTANAELFENARKMVAKRA